MKKLIETVKTMASQLDKWVTESRTGGWSTHQVDPMTKRASDLRLAVAEAERRLSKWQGMPNGDGHYWVRYRAWNTSTNPKILKAEFTTDLMLIDTDENTGECYLSSAMLGPTEMDMRDVGEDFEFCGPLKAPAPPVLEEVDCD